MKIGAKMESEKHEKSPKIRPWGAKGRIFIDFGASQKNKIFYDLPKSARRAQKSEKIGLGGENGPMPVPHVFHPGQILEPAGEG